MLEYHKVNQSVHRLRQKGYIGCLGFTQAENRGTHSPLRLTRRHEPSADSTYLVAVFARLLDDHDSVSFELGGVA